MKKHFPYKNIFMYASLQFCGHMDTYFIERTERLVVYLINPRLKSKQNLLRIYSRGRLVSEFPVWSSDNLFLYYASWYVHNLYFCFKYFAMRDTVIVLAMHPVVFFSMSMVKLFRSVTYVYWIGDFFPPTKLSLRLFERLKKFYHDKVDFRYYLSDTINGIFNGRKLHDETHRTVMWGLRATTLQHSMSEKRVHLLFIGLLKEGQELDIVFSLLSKHPWIHLSIIGICPDNLYRKFMSLVRTYRIEKQVFFPNSFYNDEELLDIARSCHIGVALYDPSPLSSTYYTDPGKVKAYAEYRLPIIMSDTSNITEYIRKYRAGEIIELNQTSLYDAIMKIRKNYGSYLSGVDAFNRAFYYTKYYARLFSFVSQS